MNKIVARGLWIGGGVAVVAAVSYIGWTLYKHSTTTAEQKALVLDGGDIATPPAAQGKTTPAQMVITKAMAMQGVLATQGARMLTAGQLASANLAAAAQQKAADIKGTSNITVSAPDVSIRRHARHLF